MNSGKWAICIRKLGASATAETGVFFVIRLSVRFLFWYLTGLLSLSDWRDDIAV